MMQREIILQNKTVSYTLRKSRRARRVRLAVYHDGSVVLTTPIGFQENIAEKFIYQKASWLLSKLYFFSQFQENPVLRFSRKDYLKHKDQALVFVVQKVEQLNKIYAYSYNKISVKNQKTCWGSCSRKGNLNFNYKILFLHEKAQNYIIVHELCHLKEFNHSKSFWNLVGQVMPDYLEIKKGLRQNGILFK